MDTKKPLAASNGSLGVKFEADLAAGKYRKSPSYPAVLERTAEQQAKWAAHLVENEARRVKSNAEQAHVVRDLISAAFNKFDVALFDGRQGESDQLVPDIPPTTTWAENDSPGRVYLICGRTVGLQINIPDDAIRGAVRRLADKIFGVSPVVIEGKSHFGRSNTLLYRTEGEPIVSQGKDFPSWSYLPIEVIGAGRMIAISDTSQGFDARRTKYEGLAPYAVPRIHGVPGECTVTPIPPPGSAKWSDLPSISEAMLADFMAAVPSVMPPGLHVARARNQPRLDAYTPPATITAVADILRADGGLPIDGHSPHNYVHDIGAQVFAATEGKGFEQWADCDVTP